MYKKVWIRCTTVAPPNQDADVIYHGPSLTRMPHPTHRTTVSMSTSAALAILGAVFWSIQLLPQIILNHVRGMEQRRLERQQQQLSQATRQADPVTIDHWVGLQPSMMLLWAFAGLFLSLHNILSFQHPALIAQAHILSFLSILTWAQVMFFSPSHPGWTLMKTICVSFAIVLTFASIEMAFVLGFRATSFAADSRPPKALILTLASLSAAGLGLGVLRHYIDCLAHRCVRGISWTFVFLDAAGDITSLLSVLLAPSSQTPTADQGTLSHEKNAAIAIYATELALWLGLMTLGLVWNAPPVIRRQIRTRRERGSWLAVWSRITFSGAPRRTPHSGSINRRNSSAGSRGEVTRQSHDNLQLNPLPTSVSTHPSIETAQNSSAVSVRSASTATTITSGSIASRLSRRSGSVFRTATRAGGAEQLAMEDGEVRGQVDSALDAESAVMEVA